MPTYTLTLIPYLAMPVPQSRLPLDDLRWYVYNGDTGVGRLTQIQGTITMNAVPERHYHDNDDRYPDDPIWNREIAEEYAERDGTTVRACHDVACIDPEEQRSWHSGHHDTCPICQHYSLDITMQYSDEDADELDYHATRDEESRYVDECRAWDEGAAAGA